MKKQDSDKLLIQKAREQQKRVIRGHMVWNYVGGRQELQKFDDHRMRHYFIAINLDVMLCRAQKIARLRALSDVFEEDKRIGGGCICFKFKDQTILHQLADEITREFNEAEQLKKEILCNEA